MLAPDEWCDRLSRFVLERSPLAYDSLKHIDGIHKNCFRLEMPHAISEQHLKLIRSAVEAARSSNIETGRSSPSPKVGAAILRHDGSIVSAYRGEFAAGDHAEYTLLEKKLKHDDLTGCIIASTLEPCVSRKTHTPCSEHLIRRKLGTVIIGALDPNPAIYGMGYRKLVESGISVDFFPEAERNMVVEDNREFLNSYANNPAMEGIACFDYSNNDGVFTFGRGDFKFTTKWSERGDHSIYSYNDHGVKVALALQRNIAAIEDAGALDFSSRVRAPSEGDILVGRNGEGHFIAMKIIRVSTRVQQKRNSMLELEYRICENREGDFRKAPESPYSSATLN